MADEKMLSVIHEQVDASAALQRIQAAGEMLPEQSRKKWSIHTIDSKLAAKYRQ